MNKNLVVNKMMESCRTPGFAQVEEAKQNQPQAATDFLMQDAR